jgi:predicted permease
MDNFLLSVSVVTPLFLTMAAGYALRRFNIFTERFTADANKVCFTIFIPSLIFYNIYSSWNTVSGELPMVAFAIVCNVATVLFLLCTIPFIVKDKQKVGAVIQAMFRCNALIFGLPISMNLYGTAGIAPMSIILTVTVPVYNFWAVVVLSLFNPNRKWDRNTARTVLLDLITNPLIIAAILAVLVGSLQITLPATLLSVVDSVSGIATPLALMALGASFEFKAVSGNHWYLIAGCAYKMLLMPAILISIAVLAGFRDARLLAITALYASPVAVSSYVMTKEADGDYELAGQYVVFTTMVSIFSIFGFVYVLISFDLI